MADELKIDVRGKLVELLRNSPHLDIVKGYKGNDFTYEQGADWLIAHGVTVQEWISVKDHTPKENGCYLIAGNHWWDGKPVAREAFWNGAEWLSCYDKGNISRRVTHWMQLPTPPKGE